jgi:sulfur carrier protein ThiS
LTGTIIPTIIDYERGIVFMRVSVYLHTILQQNTPQGLVRQLEVTLPPGSNLLDLLVELNIQLDPEHIMLVVNGVMVEENTQVSDGDRVNLMPAISGGCVSL